MFCDLDYVYIIINIGAYSNIVSFLGKQNILCRVIKNVSYSASHTKKYGTMGVNRINISKKMFF